MIYKAQKTIVINNGEEIIPNVFELPRVGGGHDGRVFIYGGKAIKLLKYDIQTRKDKKLMTYQKALYFRDRLRLNRITQPVDIALDTDGVYSGYVMNHIISVKDNKSGGYNIPDCEGFTCGDLIESSELLREDFNELSKKKVVANDINEGSYIISSDFLRLCDMDKYEILDESIPRCSDKNRQALNFAIAKFLYIQMRNSQNLSKEDLRKLIKWVKKCANSLDFLPKLLKEIGCESDLPIYEYAIDKSRSLLK